MPSSAKDKCALVHYINALGRSIVGRVAQYNGLWFKSNPSVVQHFSTKNIAAATTLVIVCMLGHRQIQIAFTVKMSYSFNLQCSIDHSGGIIMVSVTSIYLGTTSISIANFKFD